MASFVTNFWQKVEFLGNFMKPAAAASFNFFPAKLTVSTFMPNHGFMKLPKNSTFCQKWSQKLPFLLSVSSETGDKKKKEPGFHVKTKFW